MDENANLNTVFHNLHLRMVVILKISLGIADFLNKLIVGEIGGVGCFIFFKDRQHVPTLGPRLPKLFVAHWNYEKTCANTKKRRAYTRMSWFCNAP